MGLHVHPQITHSVSLFPNTNGVFFFLKNAIMILKNGVGESEGGCGIYEVQMDMKNEGVWLSWLKESG